MFPYRVQGCVQTHNEDELVNTTQTFLLDEKRDKRREKEFRSLPRCSLVYLVAHSLQSDYSRNLVGGFVLWGVARPSIAYRVISAELPNKKKNYCKKDTVFKPPSSTTFVHSSHVKF